MTTPCPVLDGLCPGNCKHVTEEQACDLIEAETIIGTHPFPAGIEFVLRDGQRLTLWDSGYEVGRHWELWEASRF